MEDTECGIYSLYEQIVLRSKLVIFCHHLDLLRRNVICLSSQIDLLVVVDAGYDKEKGVHAGNWADDDANLHDCDDWDEDSASQALTVFHRLMRGCAVHPFEVGLLKSFHGLATMQRS